AETVSTPGLVAFRISLAWDARPVPLILAAAAPAVRRFVVHVTPEMIRHSRLLDVLYFVGFFYSVAVLVLVLKTGMSARVRDVAARAVRWQFLVAMLYAAIVGLIVTALQFPL